MSESYQSDAQGAPEKVERNAPVESGHRRSLTRQSEPQRLLEVNEHGSYVTTKPLGPSLPLELYGLVVVLLHLLRSSPSSTRQALNSGTDSARV